MTKTNLRRAGALLLGDQWQRPLARALGVSDRLVRRWAAGDRPVPAWVVEEMMGLLQERQRALNIAERLLNRQ